MRSFPQSCRGFGIGVAAERLAKRSRYVFCRFCWGSSAGAPFATVRPETSMFRALALAIVFVVTAGPSSTLLCSGWCDDREAPATAADSCGHANPSAGASVAGNDACENLLGIATFVREEVRRTTTGSDRHAALIAPRYRVMMPVGVFASLHTSQPDSSFEQRPLTTILRV